MSKYREIQTEFVNANSLLKALSEIFGRENVFVSGNVTQNNVELYSGWVKGAKAAMAVKREGVSNRLGMDSRNLSSDLGFRYSADTKRYTISLNDMDEYRTRELIPQIKQAYAKHEIRRQAQMKGYTVREVRLTDGTIQLQLNHN